MIHGRAGYSRIYSNAVSLASASVSKTFLSASGMIFSVYIAVGIILTRERIIVRIRFYVLTLGAEFETITK